MKKLFFLLVCLFAWSSTYAYDGRDLWGEIQVLCNIESDHPLYPSTQRVNIFNAAVGGIDQMSMGSKQIDTLVISADVVEYDLSNLDVLLSVADVASARVVGVEQFLRRVSVSDVNKYSRAAGTVPRFFYSWASIIGFAPTPGTSDSVIIYWSSAHRWFGSESSVFYATPYYNSALLFNAAALYQQRENNQAAYQNLMGIAQSMASDIGQIEKMIRDSKDIIFLPEVYEE